MDGENKNLNIRPPLWGLVLATVIIAVFGVYFSVLTRNALKTYNYIGKSSVSQDRITVSGIGKVTAKPDIAAISIGLITEKSAVVAAQKENTDKMNAIVDALKNDFKVASADIQTSQYNISPKYDWTSGAPKIVGYSVSQTVQVKVRDFDKAGEIVGRAGSLGANNVSGPNFTIDDPEIYRAQARSKAIEQAKAKAKDLAKEVSINLGPIVGFSENIGPTPIPLYTDNLKMGLGGAVSSVEVAPSVEAGSEEIEAAVNITYEIR